MKREQVDELYHLLRVASNAPRDDALPWLEQSIIYGLARHLLAGGDYQSLVQFSAYYGEEFLLQPTYEAIVKAGWKPGRIVDFGAGLGWLGRGLASKLGYLPTLFVDKRQWTMVDMVADLETETGREKVREALRDDDLIVMSDFLHCLDDPKLRMLPFSPWPTVVLEYCSANMEHSESYMEQIVRYGATPILPKSYADMFPDRKVDIIDLEPYILLLVEARG